MTDEEYEKAADELLQRAVARFRAARGDAKALEAAIERYLEEGDSLQMSPYELRDYFDISSPGLLEKAGFALSELESGSEIFDKVSKARYDT